MVNQHVLIRDKHRRLKKIVKILLVVFVILFVILSIFLIGMFSSNGKVEIVIDNPLQDIVFANTDSVGEVNKSAVVEEAIIEFDDSYIDYLLVALGVGNLHKSILGYGNPIVEFVIDDETWTSELEDGELSTTYGSGDEEDLRIKLSREEAVNAMLEKDIESFMKESVTSGRTEIEMVAGKIELGSKGYLAMYKEITGEEIEIDEAV